MPSKAEKVTALACALAFALLALWFSALYFHNVVDDSLISIRYAENLAQGNGVVFNLGERVEGYTNFLWMCVSALLYWPCRLLGFDIVHALVMVNIACAAAVVGLVVLIGQQLWPKRILPVATAAGLTALDNDFGVWSILGLEKHFLAMFALLALWLAARGGARRWPYIGLCLCAVMLTRPDGGLFATAFLGSSALTLLLPHERGRALGAAPSWKALLQTAALLVLVYSSYFAWRYHYYGYLFPNTFYLKLGGSKLDAWARGVNYVTGFLQERMYIPALALLSLLGLGRPLVRTLLLWTSAHLLYITYIGGDFYPGHRFLIVIVAALALLVGHAVYLFESVIARLLARRDPQERVALALTSVLAVAMVGTVAVRGFQYGPFRTEIERWATTVERNRKYMLWLRDHKPKNASMVVGDIGSTGHYAGMHVHDFYGVIDTTIAHKDVPTLGKNKPGHEKTGSIGYFMPKKPTFIKWGYLRGDLYAYGYYARGDMPLEYQVEGIWQRDPLLETGHFDSANALHFSTRAPGYDLTGDAFARWPARGPTKHQTPIEGEHGGYVSSFSPTLGDNATGTFRTPAFALHGDQLLVRIAGGHNPTQLAVELLVDGKVVASATGRNTEAFTRSSFDIRAYRGKNAIIQVRDEAVGPWGHIMMDEVVQWVRDTR